MTSYILIASFYLMYTSYMISYRDILNGIKCTLYTEFVNSDYYYYIYADYQCNDQTYTKHIEYGGNSFGYIKCLCKKQK